MEGVSQKKKNWIDMDSDDDEEEEQQQPQKEEEKKEDKQEKFIETKVQSSQGEHNKRENENVSAQNNEEFGFINEKRRGQINDRDNHNNNGQRQSEQFSRRNDDNRNNNNNNHYHKERDGNNERRDKYTQIHAQNCAELVEALEKEHQGDSVWINCFYMGQSNPIERDELQKAFHGINFLQFDSEKDKYDNYMANIKISVGDAKKISPDQPPMYKGMYFKIRYGAKNQYNNNHHQNNQEKKSAKQQYGRNNDEERNNNANRDPAFNMKRNENNVGKFDPVASKSQQGKKDVFFIEKSENHDNERPTITNSKKKHEEEQEMKKQKNQNQDKEQTETVHDSHKGTGSTHYGEQDSLESDKIQTQQGKSNHDNTAVDSIKKTKEDKTHGDKQSSQQHQQQQQQTSQKTTERVSKNRGFNKQSEQASKEGGHKESKKEEGKAPHTHVVWVEKEVEEKKIHPVDNNGLNDDKGSLITDKSEPSKKEQTTTAENTINQTDISPQS